MKKTLKGFYLLLSSLFITLLHLPSVFAKPVLGNRLHPRPTVATTPSPGDSLQRMIHFKSVYDSLHLDLSGLSRQAFLYAQKGWKKLLNQGKILNESVMAIIDFSQPSDHKRLYVLDMKNYKVLFNTLVAHGRNSGKEWASSFSNRPASYKSSPGFYITGDTYFGNNGYSLKLEGIEKGINDKAYARAIVMHGAEYVSESYIEAQGYIGRSEGCPAVPVAEASDIIDVIKNGTCLFVYAANNHYTSRSAILK
ncbi:MAG: murein L,D-transpeptidase catalytic domain family protein [Bacteroidota bacterium]|nr:murein L,D-transpeptidase catalytic domain family protein [Bacteroidota bacterium]